ncbi:MAG TPA: hypothetical protein VGG39_37800 [Polyangiaceae bacterium]|jgi:hypothetical protein
MQPTPQSGVSAWSVTAIVVGCFVAAVLLVGLMALLVRPGGRRHGDRSAASTPSGPDPTPRTVSFGAVLADRSLQGQAIRVEGYLRTIGQSGSKWWINLVSTPGQDSEVVVCGVDADPSSSLRVGQRVAVQGTLRGAVVKPCSYEGE